MACVRCSKPQDGARDGQATHSYCKACWVSWGELVKTGGKFELPSEVEDLANRVGILLRPSKKRHGKIFRCERCNQDLSHWELLNHLFLEHKQNDTGSTDSDPSAAWSHELGRGGCGPFSAPLLVNTEKQLREPSTP